MFFMRFDNQTGSDVTINTLNNLLLAATGSPILQTATIEINNGSPVDVKGVGNIITDFVVQNGDQGYFKITWSGGMYSLNGSTANSYRNIVRSAGCDISGNYNVPINFMQYLFSGCANYNQQPGDMFDTSNWNATGSIGNNFMSYTWEGCSSLTTAVGPDTSNWNVTSIGTNFISSTWLGCSTLTTAVVSDTSNWNVTSIGNYFMDRTWQGCSSLTTAVVPDTSNWNVTTIGNNFMSNTWYNAISTLGAIVTLKGSIYTGNVRALQTNSGGLVDARVINIKLILD